PRLGQGDPLARPELDHLDAEGAARDGAEEVRRDPGQPHAGAGGGVEEVSQQRRGRAAVLGGGVPGALGGAGRLVAVVAEGQVEGFRRFTHGSVLAGGRCGRDGGGTTPRDYRI